MERQIEASTDPTLQFPMRYLLVVLVAALDLIFTHLILSLGGIEVNHVANLVLESTGFHGMVAYKFALILLVVVMCEAIARRKPHVARTLASVAIGISAVPVMLALWQLLG